MQQSSPLHHTTDRKVVHWNEKETVWISRLLCISNRLVINKSSRPTRTSALIFARDHKTHLNNRPQTTWIWIPYLKVPIGSVLQVPGGHPVVGIWCCASISRILQGLIPEYVTERCVSICTPPSGQLCKGCRLEMLMCTSFWNRAAPDHPSCLFNYGMYTLNTQFSFISLNLIHVIAGY